MKKITISKKTITQLVCAFLMIAGVNCVHAQSNDSMVYNSKFLIHRQSGLYFQNTESGWKMARVMGRQEINEILTQSPQKEIKNPAEIAQIAKIYIFWNCYNISSNLEKCGE